MASDNVRTAGQATIRQQLHTNNTASATAATQGVASAAHLTTASYASPAQYTSVSAARCSIAQHCYECHCLCTRQRHRTDESSLDPLCLAAVAKHMHQATYAPHMAFLVVPCQAVQAQQAAQQWPVAKTAVADNSIHVKKCSNNYHPPCATSPSQENHLRALPKLETEACLVLRTCQTKA